MSWNHCISRNVCHVKLITHKRRIPDSGGSVELEHDGGGEVQTMELVSSSESSLRDVEGVSVMIWINIL